MCNKENECVLIKINESNVDTQLLKWIISQHILDYLDTM